MKKLLLVITALAIYSFIGLHSPTPTCAAGTACCVYNDYQANPFNPEECSDPNNCPRALDFRGFIDGAPGKCVYVNIYDDTNQPANSLCAPTQTCVLDGGKHKNEAGTQEFSTYVCADRAVATPNLTGNTCCDYSNPAITYVPPATDTGKGFCQTGAGGTTSDIKCGADQSCSKNPTQILPDGRPVFFCVSNVTASIPCKKDPSHICINTAIGEIRTDPAGFIGQMLSIGIGVGSGIAFIMLLIGSYKLLTSQGNPDGINSAKEIITSAIIGIIFVILSVTLLQVIGLDILGLGSFGFGSR